MSNRNPEGHVTVNSEKKIVKGSRDRFSVWTEIF